MQNLALELLADFLSRVRGRQTQYQQGFAESRRSRWIWNLAAQPPDLEFLASDDIPFKIQLLEQQWMGEIQPAEFQPISLCANLNRQSGTGRWKLRRCAECRIDRV